jgi:uncharacterized protein YndB with AHSA1/START domain
VTVETVQGFSAPPEVVFNTVTDPHRVVRWLPDAMHAEFVGHGRFRIAWPTGAAGTAYRLKVQPARLRVEWRAEEGGWAGALQVLPVAAGGASVRLRMDLDGHEGEAVEPVRALVDEALTNLRREVADNLTPG